MTVIELSSTLSDMDHTFHYTPRNYQRKNNMNKVDTEYFRIVNDVLANGKVKKNRTGVDCLTIAGAMFQHDMSDGFPLLTSRKMPFKSTKVELEFFIKGLRSKKWLQDRGCHYWDGWCNPKIVAYGNDEETKKKISDAHKRRANAKL